MFSGRDLFSFKKKKKKNGNGGKKSTFVMVSSENTDYSLEAASEKKCPANFWADAK